MIPICNQAFKYSTYFASIGVCRTPIPLPLPSPTPPLLGAAHMWLRTSESNTVPPVRSFAKGAASPAESGKQQHRAGGAARGGLLCAGMGAAEPCKLGLASCSPLLGCGCDRLVGCAVPCNAFLIAAPQAR